MSLLEAHAKEKAATPDWEVFRFECLPEHGETELYKLTGAIAPRFVRGPRKGHRNWRRRDRTTERAVYITCKEQKEWEQAWSQATGKCIRCGGTGQLIVSISVKHGTAYKECPPCRGSGKSPK